MLKFNARRVSALAAVISASVMFGYPNLIAVPQASAATVSTNAALRYWVIFAQINNEQADKIREIDFDKLTSVAEVKAAYEACELEYKDTDLIANLIAATRVPHCDFEVDMTQGPYVIMPHLAQIRTCARVLRLDARRLALEGRRDEAAGRVAAILRMATHIAADKIMISSLVGVAIGEFGFKEGENLFSRGRLSPAAAQEIEDAVAAMDVKDPMMLRSAVQNEGITFPGWAEKQLDLPSGMGRIEQLRAESSKDEHGNPIERQPLKVEEARVALPQLRKAYEQLDTIWTAPDAIAAADAIEKRCAKGEFGILAKEWLPSISRAYKSAQRFVNERNEFLKKAQAAK